MLLKSESKTLIHTCTNVHALRQAYTPHDDKVPLQTALTSHTTDDLRLALGQGLRPFRECTLYSLAVTGEFFFFFQESICLLLSTNLYTFPVLKCYTSVSSNTCTDIKGRVTCRQLTKQGVRLTVRATQQRRQIIQNTKATAHRNHSHLTLMHWQHVSRLFQLTLLMENSSNTAEIMFRQGVTLWLEIMQVNLLDTPSSTLISPDHFVNALSRWLMRFNFIVLGKVELMLCKGSVDNSGLIKDPWRKNLV